MWYGEFIYEEEKRRKNIFCYIIYFEWFFLLIILRRVFWLGNKLLVIWLMEWLVNLIIKFFCNLLNDLLGEGRKERGLEI